MHIPGRSDGDDAESSSGCEVPKGAQELSILGSAHKTMNIIAGVCAIFTIVSALGLIVRHLTRYRAPKEQRQIVRIIFMPVIFSIIAWAEIMNYEIAAYLDPIGEIYESWALCALFLLFIQFVTPNGTFGSDMFEAIARVAEMPDSGKGNWPRLSWILVFQFPITELIAVIILEATEAQGTYCASSYSPKYGHLWSQLFHMLGLIAAALSILRFYKKNKSLMKARRGFAKLVVFKGFIFLHLVQTVSSPHRTAPTSDRDSY